MSEGIKCPFCGEEDFDQVGLKYHLETYCEGYRNTLSPEQKKEQKKEQADVVLRESPRGSWRWMSG